MLTRSAPAWAGLVCHIASQSMRGAEDTDNFDWRVTMASRLVNSFLAMALLTGTLLGHAQLPAKLNLNIPFDFMVGQVMFPAGLYRVQSVGQHRILLSSSRGRESLIIATRRIESDPNASRTGVVFTEANHHCQLLQLWLDPSHGEQVSELALRKRQSLRAAGETIFVAPTAHLESVSSTGN